MAGHAAPSGTEFAGASGVAAGAGYCQTGGKRNATGMWTGGNFFVWQPDWSLGYDACFKLKTKPDPEDPTSQIPIEPYGKAHVWGDYNRVSC